MKRKPITRDQLIETTHAIWHAKGLDGLTVDSLAAQLQMSKSTLYLHYEGLSDLVYEAVERLCERIDALLTDLRTDDPVETYFEVAWAYGEFASLLPSTALTQRHKLPAPARLRLDNTEARLGERIFRAAMAVGATSSVAHGVRGAFEGLTRSLHTVPQDQRPVYVAELTTALRRALRPE